MKKIVLKIGGMTCSACSSGLEKYLNKQEGVKEATVNLVLSIATITYENITVKDIERYIKEAGFTSLGEFIGIEDKVINKTDKIKLIFLGLLIIFIMYISMGNMLNLPSIPYLNQKSPLILSTTMLIITLVYLIYGLDIIKSGIKNLLHKMPNMDTLVMFSVIFSFLYSLYNYINILLGNNALLHNLYFESTCMVIYFIKLGRIIEDSSKDKTKDAIRKLVQITPSYAIVKKNNKELKVTIDEVEVGDTLVCKQGEKIAVDGIVTKGKTYVNESFITGESAPVLKEKDSTVIAGSISYDGIIEYKAKRIGRDSTISEIVKLVVESTNTKTKIQRLADKVSGIFVPVILITSLLTFIIGLLIGLPLETSLIHMVTVLVVSNGICAKKGLFLRNSEVLEKARTIDTVIFDKTGTLTYGNLKVFKTYNYSNYKYNDLINIVSNIENNSSHPISTAFKVKKKLVVTALKTINGKGIKASVNNKEYYLGNNTLLKDLKINDSHEEDYNTLINNGCSIIYVIEDKTIIGLIGVKDIVRDNIKDVITRFNDNNIEVIMLTGDNEVTAEIIAGELGITKVISNVLPKKKANTIKDLVSKGRKVIMVGDGINDAPALVNTTIGISVNDGTDVAMDSADVILMNNDISNILDLIKISKKAYLIIKENLFWAFFYNLLMIPIAMGLLENYGISMSPMFASIAMTISSLTVVINSLRLSKINL